MKLASTGAYDAVAEEGPSCPSPKESGGRRGAPAAKFDAPGLLRPLAARLAISSGHNVVLTDQEGRLHAGGTGFFHHQSRFLSRLRLRVADRSIESASAALNAPNALTAHFLAKLPASSEARRGRRAPGPTRVLEVQVDCHLGKGLDVVFRLTNRAPVRIAAPLAWSLDADFVDQGQLTAGHRRPRPSVEQRWTEPATLLIRSLRPGLRHAAEIRFSGSVAFRRAGRQVRCSIALAPQEMAEIRLELTPLFDPTRSGELPFRGAAEPRQPWVDGCTQLVASDPVVQAAWTTAAADLESLQLGDGQGEERFTPAAGIPHYVALFGRDTLMAGWQSALLNPAIQRGSLDLVGRWTAGELDPSRPAQPGRVLHQRALGPMALLGKTPFLRYYGDHSASALFLIGVADAYARSGDAAWFLARRDLALRTLDWMDRYGDLDGDGLYEYRTFAGPRGLKNQGWKDSDEAILYPDGVSVPDPIVVCEIQALFAAAKQAMANAFTSVGKDALAGDLTRQAEQARRLFQQTMWMEDEGFVALGLDADKRQIRTLASNAGESLAYGSLDEAKARRVADRLMQPDFFTGWGLRTLSASHPAYNPLAYHLGSVWPCFSALTARGFARYGFVDHLHTLARALFDATCLFEQGRLPELFGGHPRGEDDRAPGLYPDACWPQAWSAGAVILLVDTLVGLKPAAPLGAVLVDPKLPPWLPRASLAGIGLGAGKLDLEVGLGADGCPFCHVVANSTGLRIYGPGLDVPSPAEAEALRTYVGSLP